MNHSFWWAKEQMSNLLKKEVICSFFMSDLSESLMVNLLSWVTWVIRSWSLICLEQPERFAHIAHFLWATWEIRSWLLICLERSERMAHSCSFDLSKMREWAMRKWANSQPWLVISILKNLINSAAKLKTLNFLDMTPENHHVSHQSLLSHLSCPLSHVSCLRPPVSSLLSHVSCLTLLSHVSCLTSPVSLSCLMSPACLSFPV